MRLTQNKISQNIREEHDCSAPYDSLGSDIDALWNPLGPLLGLCGPFGPVWITYMPPMGQYGPLCSSYDLIWPTLDF